MKVHADAFFAQGKTHTVCQDYAISHSPNEGNPLGYAIVCDGCSSSPNTDVGARLLAHATAIHMRWLRSEGPLLSDREHLIARAAANAVYEIDAPIRSLDATLLMARVGADADGNEGTRVSMRGDGVVVSRLRNGRGYRIEVVEHEHNAPYYLSYSLGSERRNAYLKHFGDQSSVRVFVSSEEQEGWDTSLSRTFNGHPEDWFFAASEYDFVMVLSDGVQTFQELAHTGTSKSLNEVPVEQVVAHLLEIKGMNGAFLQRRCHKFLTKHCVANGWQHADDFSAAAIFMEDSSND